MSFRLDGLTALITGAGTGMGRAMAVAFAEAGAERLFLVGRRRDKLEETRRELTGVDVHVLAADVTSSEDRVTSLETVRRVAGRLDVLVHNAGLFDGSPLAATSDAISRDVYAVNVEAPLAWTRDALPLLAARGASVVGVSSTLAVKPIPVASAYNAAKAALVQLMRSLALELAPQKIRVNCVLPAIVDTPMYRGRYATDDEYRRGLEDVAKIHPLGRIGKPEDIAAATLFLASPAAGWITGVALPVDGGMLVT